MTALEAAEGGGVLAGRALGRSEASLLVLVHGETEAQHQPVCGVLGGPELRVSTSSLHPGCPGGEPSACGCGFLLAVPWPA